jgi:dolichyl-phosphate beta-glucosyltransferase
VVRSVGFSAARVYVANFDVTSVTVVVPVFDEERRLPALLDAVLAPAEPLHPTTSLSLSELIVVDDGSTDGTAGLLDERTASDPRLKVIRLPTNRGKGAAVRAGVLAAQGELALVTDVDLSTPLEEVALLAAALERGADVVIGSRALAGSRVLVHQPPYRELMGKAFNVMFRLLTRLPWRDTQCGFKLFRLATARQLFELQRVERFAYDAELCVNAHRLGLRLVEVPVTWRNSPDTRVTLVGSSLRMAFDLVHIAWRARRPFAEETGVLASYAPGERP